MAVPFLIPLPLLIAVPLILLIATVGAPALPRLIAGRRQAAYDAAVAPNMVRLELTVGRGRSTGTDAAVAAIRGLHPHRRMGVDRRWPRGWPPVELRSGLARRRAALADRGSERRAGPCRRNALVALPWARSDRRSPNRIGRSCTAPSDSLRRSSGLALGEPGRRWEQRAHPPRYDPAIAVRRCRGSTAPARSPDRSRGVAAIALSRGGLALVRADPARGDRRRRAQSGVIRPRPLGAGSARL